MTAFGKDSTKTPRDLIQLILEDDPGTRGRSIDYHVKAQVNAGRAALFASGTTLYHVLCDLAFRPEYIEPLRQEALGFSHKPLDRVNVAKLMKLDSFIHECQRWSQLTLRKQ